MREEAGCKIVHQGFITRGCDKHQRDDAIVRVVLYPVSDVIVIATTRGFEFVQPQAAVRSAHGRGGCVAIVTLEDGLPIFIVEIFVDVQLFVTTFEDVGFKISKCVL